MNWETYFRKIAEVISLKSKDNSTKIGVVIVGKGNEILSTGYNSFPRGIDDDVPERQLRPEKYFWFEHAERNAIYNAARHGVSLLGSKMFTNCSVSCTDCARAIINSGISEIWFVQNDITQNKEKWDEHALRSLIMFKEANIKVNIYSDEEILHEK